MFRELKSLVLSSLVLTCSVAAASPPLKQGEWPQWRRDAAHTGYQPLAGAVQTPAVRWKYPIGGRITDAITCSRTDGVNEVYVSTLGRITKYTATGDREWSVPDYGRSQLLGCADFIGDGRSELVVTTPGFSNVSLALIGADQGTLMWESETAPGHVGSVKAANVDGKPGLELVWAPATSSEIYAFHATLDGRSLELLWASDVMDYVSDPYSYSPIAIADADHNGRQEIVIAGGRAQVPIIVLDAATGREVRRRTYVSADSSYGIEAGGIGQLLAVVNVPGESAQRIVLVSSYGADATYMFQGALSVSGDLGGSSVVSTYPNGLSYAAGSLSDVTLNGVPELLVSSFDATSSRYTLELRDLTTLQVQRTLDNFYLLAFLKDQSIALGYRDRLDESKRSLVAVRLNDDLTFSEPLWTMKGVTLPMKDVKTLENAAATNLAPTPLFVDRNSAVIVRTSDERYVVDVTTGAIRSRMNRYGDRAVETLSAHGASGDVVLVEGIGGTLTFYDDELRLLAQHRIGGYNANALDDAHNREMVAVSDVDADGRPDISFIDSNSRLRTMQAPGGPRQRTEIATTVSTFSDPRAVVTIPGTGILTYDKGPEGSRFSMLGREGRLLWESPVSSSTEILPTGLTYGYLSNGNCPDVIFAAGPPSTFPRKTRAVSACTGRVRWTSDIGSYGDSSFAIGDVNGDGQNDVVVNYNVEKANVIDGATGQRAALPAILPKYPVLNHVDYNGSPIVVDVNSDGRAEVLNVEDNGHLALLRYVWDWDGGGQMEVVWAAPQVSVDDQRNSFAALAPYEGSWMIGVGSARGVIEGRLVRDGALAWQARLANGRVSPPPARAQQLSSVIACDIDGDGEAEFVVGSADGWLYSLDAATGTLEWSMNFGYPVGEPIAADSDGDGRSEIIVPVADGYLYSIDNRSW